MQPYPRRWQALACSRSACSSSRWATRSSTSGCRRSARSSTPARASCSGSSTATCWCSPACCSPRAASAIASGASARSCPGWWCSGSGPCSLPLSTDATMLIASRALMGLGAAGIMPTTLSILTNIFPSNERPKAIAAWAAVAGHRHRDRTDLRRLPDRALRLEQHLPDQPARRGRVPDRRLRARAGLA